MPIFFNVETGDNT